ncbi:MAG: keto-deoxy-phosphogluconate aldolase [Caldimonas sp.]
MDPLTLADHGPVIPVIVIDALDAAVPLARALVEGGVCVLEVTLRTPVALRAIEAIARAVPEAIVGAGTLRGAADVQAALDAGCRFAVSPGYTAAIGSACAERGLALLPGVATASEVLEALAGPFADVLFCPTGGIDLASAPHYLALPNVRVVGGSWLTPADALTARDWPRITHLARAARALRA